MTYGDPESIRDFRGNNDLLKYGFVKIELWTFPWFMAYSIVVSVINAFSSSLRPFNQKRNVSTITETFSETSTKIILLKKVFLEISQNSQETNCAKGSFLIKLQACNFVKRETLLQVFFCEFCEISKIYFL